LYERVAKGDHVNILEHDVAASLGAIRILERIPSHRRLRHPGQKRSLRDGDIFQILAQVYFSALGETLNAEASLMPDVDRIRVVFENLFLAQALFDVQGDERLRD